MCIFIKKSVKNRLSIGSMSVGGRGAVASPWIFKHCTNIVDRGLKVLFFGLFCYFWSSYPLPPTLEEANSAIFRYFLLIFGLFCVGPPLLENFLPTPLVGGSAPKPPFASGSWGFYVQTSALLFLPIVTTLSSLFLTLTVFYFPWKKNKITTVNVLLLLLSHFSTYFSFKLFRFCCLGAQEYFFPQGAGYPSYATGYFLFFDYYWRC